MRCDFFIVPVRGGEAETERLNALLNAARVLTVDRDFVADGTNSFWAICVQSHAHSQRASSNEKKQPVDYRDVLSPEDFTVFARLREIRKSIATADGIPPYSVFTNEQLAQMVLRKVTSLTQLKEINGIGDARVEKYGTRFLSVLVSGMPGAEGPVA